MTVPKLATLPRVHGVVLALLLLLTGWAPVTLLQAQNEDKRHPLITVQLRNGERVTLRDPELGVPHPSERPPATIPPGTPVGPLPGNTPGGSPGDGGGTTQRDPRQPTHNLSGTPRRPGRFLEPGLTVREMYRLRRVYVVLEVEGKPVPAGVTYGDFFYKDGAIRHNVRMTWTMLSGWERPGRQGEFYFFEARDILYLEFPEY